MSFFLRCTVSGKRKCGNSNANESFRGRYDCYKCGKGFFDKTQHRCHENACRSKGRMELNTMSYTQTEISRSVCNEKNPLLPQNAQVGEAFRTQLLNKFSLSTVANQLRNADEDDERVDCDSQDVDFDPMDVDDDESDSAEHRDAQESLPKRYRSKMKRYEKFKNKHPDPPGSDLPERFEYVGKTDTKIVANSISDDSCCQTR